MNNNSEDPIDEFLNGLKAKTEPGNEPKTTVDPIENEGGGNQVSDQQAQGVENPAVPETNPTQEIDLSKLTAEQQVAVFKSLTGIEISSIEDVKGFLGEYQKIPEYKKVAEMLPKAISELKKKQDVMSYFPDEDTYKVVQLTKEPKYRGKEPVLYNLFRNDIDKMSDIEAIGIGATLEKGTKISNPLRSAIKQLGMDPDDVLTNFEDLSQDDKDDIANLADEYREKLKVLKTSIPSPIQSGDFETELFNMDARAKDDFAKQVATMKPFALDIVRGVKELKVTDDFNFKVEMTPEEVESYTDFLTEASLSGEFNLATDDGKKELYDALLTEIWVDNREKVMKSYDTKLRAEYEQKYREKYDNAKPLGNSEPNPSSQGAKKNPLLDLVDNLINERL
jgi:hypothetical protein